MRNVQIIENPYVKSLLSELRKATTGRERFRIISEKLFDVLVAAAIEESDMKAGKVKTPVGVGVSHSMVKDFVAISVLRSGIATIPSVLKALPEVRIGFAGVVRNEATAKPSEYYTLMCMS